MTKKFIAFTLCAAVISALFSFTVTAAAALPDNEQTALSLYDEDGENPYDTLSTTGVVRIGIDKENAYRSDGITYVKASLLYTALGMHPYVIDACIFWEDAIYGKYIIDTGKSCIYGPELVYKISEPQYQNGVLFLPAEDISGALYLSASVAKPSRSSPKRELVIERLTPTRLVVDKFNQIAALYGEDRSGNEKVMRYLIVSTGRSSSATPVGKYKSAPIKLGTDNFYYFSLTGVWVKWVSVITGNVCIHSIYTHKRGNLSTADAQRGYEALGTNVSAGCVRVMLNEARFLHDYAITIEIIRGAESEESSKIKEKLLEKMVPFDDWAAYIT